MPGAGGAGAHHRRYRGRSGRAGGIDGRRHAANTAPARVDPDEHGRCPIDGTAPGGQPRLTPWHGLVRTACPRQIRQPAYFRCRQRWPESMPAPAPDRPAPVVAPAGRTGSNPSTGESFMQRRHSLKTLPAAAALAGLSALPAHAQDSIKVGILHSLSGTMAISETVLKDTVLMAIDEINASGGVLGKKLEPVAVDPASNWPLFAEKARQLLGQDKVAVIFGCWTSVSRKSVLPVVEEMNGLLFYPVQYEGEELSKNVVYTGAAPNQQDIPAVDYLMSKDAGSAKRWGPLGTDHVYPGTTNKILRAYLRAKGVKDSDIAEKSPPFGHSDYQTIVADIQKFSQGGKTAVVSTINGDSNVPFYKELGNAGLKAKDVPVVAFSVGEEELRGVDTKPLVGHLAAWNYFQSIKSPANTEFIKKWSGYARAKGIAGHKDRPLTNDPMEASYIGIHMWKQAVEKAKSTDVDKVIAAMAGQTFKAPSGITSMMDEKNHHLHKSVFIGEIKADGQFNVVWKTPGPVKAKPWSPYIEGNDKKPDEPEKK